MILQDFLDAVENAEVIVKGLGHEIWNTACFGWVIPSCMENAIVTNIEVTIVDPIMENDKEVVLVVTIED